MGATIAVVALHLVIYLGSVLPEVRWNRDISRDFRNAHRAAEFEKFDFLGPRLGPTGLYLGPMSAWMMAVPAAISPDPLFIRDSMVVGCAVALLLLGLLLSRLVHPSATLVALMGLIASRYWFHHQVVPWHSALNPPVLALVLLGAYFVLGRHRRLWTPIMLGAAVVSVQLHATAVPALAAALVVIGLRWRWIGWRWCTAAFAVAVLCGVPWLLIAHQGAASAIGVPDPAAAATTAWVAFAGDWHNGGDLPGGIAGILSQLLIVFAVVGVAIAGLTGKGMTFGRLLVLCLGATAIIMYNASADGSPIRYTAMLVLPGTLLAAMGFQWFVERLGARVTTVIGVSAAILLAAMGIWREPGPSDGQCGFAAIRNVAKTLAETERVDSRSAARLHGWLCLDQAIDPLWAFDAFAGSERAEPTRHWALISDAEAVAGTAPTTTHATEVIIGGHRFSYVAWDTTAEASFARPDQTAPPGDDHQRTYTLDVPLPTPRGYVTVQTHNSPNDSCPLEVSADGRPVPIREQTNLIDLGIVMRRYRAQPPAGAQTMSVSFGPCRSAGLLDAF
ncbi:MAG: hypothetical protein ACI9OJ_005490 [Myxococcota bacterium]|jgi:hypothetical protein